MGNAAISSGKIDNEGLLQLARLYGAQGSLLDEFEAAHPELSETLKAVYTDAQPQLAAMRRQLLGGGTDNDLSGMRASDWHSAATDRVNLLRAIEIEVLASMAEQAQALASAQSKNLIAIGTGLAAAVTTAIAFSIVVGLGVVRPLRTLTQAVRNLAKGDAEDATVTVNSKDEVGAMALAVDEAISAARARALVEREEDLRRTALRQAEVARVEEERACRSAELERALAELDRGLTALSNGQLHHRITAQLGADLDPLRVTFNSSAATLENLVSVASSNARSIKVACFDLRQGADELSRRTAGQAAALEQAAAALEEVTTAVKMSAAGAEEAKSSVMIAAGDTSDAANVVADTVAAMTSIARSSDKIFQIIGVIDEIAFQTNLLALNAGVEAARAGDAGKGFAVVAQEVRELAQRSATAAREIKELTERANGDVAKGVLLVGRTGDALTGIQRHVEMINKRVLAIAQSTLEQSAALSEVTMTVGQLDQITQQNASMVEQSNNATQSLAEEAEHLRAQLAMFEVEPSVTESLTSAKRAA